MNINNNKPIGAYTTKELRLMHERLSEKIKDVYDELLYRGASV
tara:strand:- start:165 stop:293 length:129 start_codon:yes stop_codon:yes gene_type:complete